MSVIITVSEPNDHLLTFAYEQGKYDAQNGRIKNPFKQPQMKAEYNRGYKEAR